MRFVELLPDANVLIAMPEQELALMVLRVAEAELRNGRVHPTSIQQAAGPAPGHQGPDYPQHLRPQIEQALDEALNWLTVQGLILPDSGDRNGWMRLSRRAQQLLREGNFRDYARAVAFPKELIHPSIREEVWLELARGALADAVFKSFRAVEVAVREAGGYGLDLLGVRLVRRAFGEDGALADADQERGEAQALSDLFAGAIGSYKNPHSHRTVELNDPVEAQEMIVLASHLLRIVEARRVKAGR